MVQQSHNQIELKILATEADVPFCGCLAGSRIAGRKPGATARPFAVWKVEERHLREALRRGTGKTVELTLVMWQGRWYCAYLNDYRVAGGKPWAGGTTIKTWRASRAAIEAVLAESYESANSLSLTATYGRVMNSSRMAPSSAQ